MSTYCGVTVQTWGTFFGAGSGMLQYLDSKMFGGNVGHAAIALTIPDNKENEELIKKYCMKADDEILIPYKQRTISFADGTKEKVYEIRFSWWPTSESAYLENELNLDQLSEWVGVDFTWAEEAASIFQPEKRLYTGKLAQTEMRLGPMSVSHHRNLQRYGIKLCKLEAEKQVLDKAKKTAKLIIDKLEEKIARTEIKSKVMSKSEMLLLQNLLPEIVEQYDPKRDISNEYLSNILENVKERLNKVKLEQKINQDRINLVKTDMLKNLEIAQTQLNKIRAAKVFLQQKMDTGINLKKFSDLSNILYLDIAMKNWRDYIKNPQLEVTQEEVRNLMQFFDKDMDSLIKDIDKLQALEYLDDYLTLGNPPDNIVYLPIKKQPESEIGFENGMDIEAMLKQMHLLITENSTFEFFGKNCSETVGKILEAGAPKAHLKAVAANRAWGAFGTPQMVYNAAVRIQEGIYNQEESNIWHSISNFNPIERVEGKLLKILIDEKASRIKKYLVGSAFIFVGTLDLALAFVRSCFNPMDAVNNASMLLTYAYLKNYTPLKIAATLILSPVVVIFAIPAAIQLTIKAVIINPVKKLFKFFRFKQSKISLIDSHDQKARDRDAIDKDFSKYINSKVVVINESKPMDAITNYIQALKTSDDCIPVFSNRSAAAVHLFVQKRTTIPEELQTLINSLPGIFDLKKSKLFSMQECVNELNNISIQRLNKITSIYRTNAERRDDILQRREAVIYSRRDTATSPRDDMLKEPSKPKTILKKG